MEYTLYQLVSFFLIYSFIGWSCEVAFAAVRTGTFVNRGFLNGPVCPIYGVGMTFVILMLTPFTQNIPLLFLGSVILTTVLEFITGFILEKFFKTRWWDYTDKKFNIKGYVCLKFSVVWGLACVFVMKIVHPSIKGFVNFIPHVLGVILLCIFGTVFIADIIVTVTALINYRSKIIKLDKLKVDICNISGTVGEKICETVKYSLKLKEKAGSHTGTLKGSVSQDIEKLKQRYNKLYHHKSFGITRLEKAFPKLKEIKETRRLK